MHWPVLECRRVAKRSRLTFGHSSTYVRHCSNKNILVLVFLFSHNKSHACVPSVSSFRGSPAGYDRYSGILSSVMMRAYTLSEHQLHARLLGHRLNFIHAQAHVHRIIQDDRAGSSPFGVRLSSKDGGHVYLASFRYKIKRDKEGVERRKARDTLSIACLRQGDYVEIVTCASAMVQVYGSSIWLRWVFNFLIPK